MVDEEPHIRILLEQTLEELEDEGVELLIEQDGESALNTILTEKPDLVFLDVMMPKMNGFDVCKTVRQHPEFQETYIILLTAKGQEFDKQ